MSDAFWAGLFFLVTMIVKDWLDQRRADRAEATRKAMAQQAADEAKEVKATLVETTKAASAQMNAVVDKVDAVSERVEQVHKATNGLTTALGDARMAQGTAEGMIAGIKEAQARADERANNKP